MKKFIKTISKILPLLLIIGIALFPETSHAQSVVTYIKEIAFDGLINMLAGISYALLTFTSLLVTAGASFLSVSINITTHIGDFFNGIPALSQVWIIVRNMTSMFIIFMLLLTSIQTILGVGKTSIQSLIGKIIMAGLLINFSLFFCKILIDTSNLVSLQFFRAIAPGATVSYDFSVSKTFNDGGLANVLMDSLKIPKIYDAKKISASKSLDISFGILIATLAGIIMMLGAAFSFFAAAIAITIRTGILLFVMALSPLYFAAKIFPAAGKKADELQKLFTGQLLFMPAYLFLMYVALTLISSDGFKAVFNMGTTAASPGGEGPFGATFIAVLVQYIVAIIFIDAPLVMAMSLGAIGAKWAPSAELLGRKLTGAIGRNTAGEFAKAAGKRFDVRAAQATEFASKGGVGGWVVGKTIKGLRNTGISQATRGALTTAEKAKYGSDQNISDVEKVERTRRGEISNVQRSLVQKANINKVLNAQKTGLTPKEKKDVRSEIGKMTAKEILDLDYEILTKPEVAVLLSSSQVDKVMDTKEADGGLTESQKTEFKGIRKTELAQMLEAGLPDDVKAHMESLSGKELAKLEGVLDSTGKAILTNVNVMNSYLPSQLKDMSDIDHGIRGIIGAHIRGRPKGSHKAGGWIDNSNNKNEWA